VSVDEPDPPGIEGGLNVADIPTGRPETLRLTSPENPPSDVDVTVRVVKPGTSTFCVPGETVNVKVGAGEPAQAERARNTFNRPPVRVRCASAGTSSVEFSRLALRAGVLKGHADNTSAAAPATIGDAMDVPLRRP